MSVRSEAKRQRGHGVAWCLLACLGCTALRQGVPAAADASPDAPAPDVAAPDVAAPDVAPDLPAPDAPAMDAPARDVAPDVPAPDVAVDVGDPGRIEAPRPVAPLATTWLTTGRVTFRWAPVRGQRAVLQLCRDALCASVERTFDAGEGASFALPAPTLAQGRHWWRLYGAVGAVQGLYPSPAWHFVVEGRGDAPARSEGPTMDLDNDGRRNVVAGAPGALMGDGLVHIWRYNTEVVMNREARLGGPRQGVGAVVAAAGDMNGDGLGDLAHTNRPGPYAEGEVQVLRGWRDGSPMPYPVLRNVIEDRALGTALVGVGDLDGDGYADLAVGQPPADPGMAGRVLIYAGAQVGFRAWDGRTGVAVTWARRDSNVEASFGATLAAPGDLNGDGFDDLVVGVPARTPTAAGFAGEVHVYLGGAEGPSTAPLRIPSPDPSDDYYAGSLAGIGDVNGDGYPDLAIGTPGNGPRPGRFRVHHGGPSGLRVMADAVIPAPAGAARFAVVLAGVGDIDRDGFADVAVGAPFTAGYGRAYVYRGSPSGLRPTDVLVLDAPGRQGPFAEVLGSRGDVDGDGFPDLLVGAPTWNGNIGRLTIFLGVAGGVEATPWRTLEGISEGSRFATSL